jgi:hypothetical protein
MAYTDIDFASKAAVKRALVEGKRVTVYQPGIGTVPENGTVDLEGPHYPKPHKWYGTGKMVNGLLVEIK